MNVNDQYCIAAPQVVSETIDGEVIVIHLEAGVYYSMHGTAATIWNLIEQGASVRQIAEALTRQYDGDMLTVSFAIAPFIEQLVQEKLIIPFNGDLPTLDAVVPTNRLPFATPLIEIYKDMQNLLMIDPIHEVQDVGWPQQNPAT